MIFVVFFSKLFLCSGHFASSNRPLSSKVHIWFAVSSLTFFWWFLGTQTNLSDFLLTVQEIPCSDLAGLQAEERSELSTMTEWNAGLRVRKQCEYTSCLKFILFMPDLTHLRSCSLQHFDASARKSTSAVIWREVGVETWSFASRWRLLRQRCLGDSCLHALVSRRHGN